MFVRVTIERTCRGTKQMQQGLPVPKACSTCVTETPGLCLRTPLPSECRHISLVVRSHNCVNVVISQGVLGKCLEHKATQGFRRRHLHKYTRRRSRRGGRRRLHEGRGPPRMGIADATVMRAYVWGRPDMVTLAQFGGQGDLGRLGRRQRVPINLRPHHHRITITSSLHHRHIKAKGVTA